MFSLEVLQAEAKRDLTNQILESMENYLDNSQLLELNKSLHNNLGAVQVYHQNNTSTDFEERNQALFDEFMKAKKLKGLSPQTLEYYSNFLNKFLKYCNKLVLDYNPEELREFLGWYQELGNCGNVSLNNLRRILSSFYTYLHTEEYILKNPMRAVKHIKEPKRVKKPFTAEEVEIMRKCLHHNEKYTLRDIALFELLLSSGIRLTECRNLNIKDLNFDEQTFNVIGKGNKERKCYFGTKAKLAIQDYLATRDDDNPALFVSLYESQGRVDKSGIGTRIRELGRECNIKEVHPHRFRRTFSSKLLSRNVPLEQIQKMLGHDNINTTLLYVSVDDEDVKLNYQKHMR